LLDAEVAAADRLADYSHRTTLALLTGRTPRERLTKICHLFVRGALVTLPGQESSTPGARIRLHQLMIGLKMLCLQLLAVLYICAQCVRHWIKEDHAHVG
jgi:hypothetical protein